MAYGGLNKYTDAAAELEKNPVSKHQIQPEYGDGQADAGRDCRHRLARPNYQARTRAGKINFPRSLDHEQDWQPDAVDPYSCCMCDHTYIHIYYCILYRLNIYFLRYTGVTYQYILLYIVQIKDSFSPLYRC